MPIPADRVRARTAASVLRRIDARTIEDLARLADEDAGTASAHLDRLDREWDTDRAIEAEAAVTGLLGLALAAVVDRRFMVLTGIVGAAVFMHAATGWYPLLPVMRRLGIRTAREIERERYAAKVLRGDFSGMDASVPAAAPSARAVEESYQ